MADKDKPDWQKQLKADRERLAELAKKREELRKEKENDGRKT